MISTFVPLDICGHHCYVLYAIFCLYPSGLDMFRISQRPGLAMRPTFKFLINRQ
ncbi:hypothetical protein PILCRDRAFT_821058 [Piloderma croceum F 1598]|uniref:Uncharacterized protein n=1 Tax=Piloderma croceum (strain F 1598) TaxID=765440 RepID=A0A0C3FPS1_PILCF|nr:hypothetical protein PILCRDRAFT_821058 [Piloderma croceum F 1598]